MSIIASNYIWNNAKNLSDRALVVGLKIADHHNGQTGQCNPSIETLIEETGRSRSTVIRGIKDLEDATETQIERRKNRNNRYTFPGCKSWSVGVTPDTHVGVIVDTPEVSPLTPESEDKPEVEPEQEVLSERTAPSASAGGEKALLSGFTAKKCRADKNVRLRFYMDSGRLHTRADHFHKPKNSKRPLTFSQVDALRIWFDQLPLSGCAVMNFAIKNWPKLRKVWEAKHPPIAGKRWSRIQQTPTISALEKYGSAELLELYTQSEQRAALRRVEANLQEQAA